MAPEQAEGRRDIGPLADVWALGAILYELLTGRPPFNGETTWDTLEQVRTQDPTPPRQLQPKVPRDLETICLKCLQKQPHRRYASALALADDLRRFLEGQPILARPISVGERVVKWIRRRPTTAALLGVLLTALLGAAGLLVWHNVDTQQQLAAERQHVRELVEQEAERKRVATLREQDTALLSEGRAAAQSGQWEAAKKQFALALSRAAGAESLPELRQEAKERLEEAERGATARHRLAEFVHKHDQALTLLTRYTGQDSSVDRKATEDAAREALAVFGITPAGDGAPDLDPHFFDNDERARVTADCYELLLVLASATATPPPPSPSPLPPGGEGRVRGVEPVQIRRALTLLDQAAHLLPATRASHLRRAQFLRLLGDLENARQQEAMAEKVPLAGATDHFLVGDVLYARGNLEEAVRSFDAALRQRPDHFWAQYYQALCYLKLATTRPEEARTFWLAVKTGLTTCISRKPHFIWSYILRGYVLGELGDVEAAEKDFDRALGLDPDRAARYAVHVDRGTMRGRNGQLRAAEKELRQAIELEPKQFQAHVNLARLFQAAHKLDAARQEYDRAIALEKRLSALYRLRARLHVERQDAQAALADFDEAVRLAGNSRKLEVALDHVERGNLLRRIGKREEALDAAGKAMATFPTLADAYRLRGEVLMELNRAPEAITWLSVYVRMGQQPGSTAPPHASVYRARALACASVGKLDEALADYNQALALKPDAVTYAGRGWAHLELEAPRLALADFERALAEDASLGDAYTGRGLVRVLRGDHRNGTDDAERAVRRGPNNPRWTYEAARVFAQAAGQVEKDRALPPRDVQDLRSRYEDRAVTLLGKALELRPSGQRAAFWANVVAKDSALVLISSSPGFLLLSKEYGTAKEH